MTLCVVVILPRICICRNLGAALPIFTRGRRSLAGVQGSRIMMFYSIAIALQNVHYSSTFRSFRRMGSPSLSSTYNNLG